MEENITQLLLSYSNGQSGALEKLLPAVYQELRRLAESYMRKEKSGHTLQATALVHEAYFKLIDQNQVQWQNRAQFFGLAAQVMRRLLIDHARAKVAAKRGGMDLKVSFDEAVHWNEDHGPDLLALDGALKQLENLDPRQAKVVELKYFGGMSIEEIATALETSPATVKRDWAMARAWLLRELSNDGG